MVVAVFSGNENDVLVLKYSAVVAEARQVVDATNRPGPAAMQRFRDELLRLADAGWMHQWAVRGTYYWRVTDRTQTLVLDDWSVLRPLDEVEDRDEILAKIARLA